MKRNFDILLEKVANYKKSHEDFMNQMKLDLGGCFQDFLENFPNIEAVRWPQYTPYFNDGDPCIFSAYGIQIKFKEEDDFVDEYSDNRAKYQDVFDKIEIFRNQIPDEVLERVFGDHIQVTISRDNIQVDEYDHD